jgi:cation:H+ antiporter
MDISLSLPASVGVFLLSAVVVVVSSIMLAISGDVIASRTKWGRLWVGALLVAGATSLPELVTVVAAVRIGAPSLAAGTIFGANLFNMTKLTLVIALVGGREVFQQIRPQQAQLLGLALVLTALATLFAALRLDAKWLMVSPSTLVILAVYIVGTRIIYGRSMREQEAEPVGESEHSLAWGGGFFLLAAAGIFIAAPFLAVSADRIAELAGVSESFVGVLAVAFVTSLPELVALITAMRIGAHDLALSGLYGSNAINVVVLGIADLFQTPGSLFGSLDVSHVVAGLFAVLLMGLGMIQVIRRKRVTHFSLTQPSTVVVVGLYLIGLFLVFRLS